MQLLVAENAWVEQQLKTKDYPMSKNDVGDGKKRDAPDALHVLLLQQYGRSKVPWWRVPRSRTDAEFQRARSIVMDAHPPCFYLSCSNTACDKEARDAVEQTYSTIEAARFAARTVWSHRCTRIHRCVRTDDPFLFHLLFSDGIVNEPIIETIEKGLILKASAIDSLASAHPCHELSV